MISLDDYILQMYEESYDSKNSKRYGQIFMNIHQI